MAPEIKLVTVKILTIIFLLKAILIISPRSKPSSGYDKCC